MMGPEHRMKHIFAFVAALLAPAASHAAGPVCDAVWIDAARGDRAIPVRIRMPAGTGKAPVILFSHGLGGSIDSGRAWAQAWAEAGLIVINLQHPGSDRAIIGTGRLRDAMTPAQLIARALDVRFAIDELGRQRRDGVCDLARADRAHIGMAGHSFGAHTTQAVAGEHFPVTGGDRLTDSRIKAAIAFSPSPPARGSAEAAFANIRIPFFSITGTKDTVFLMPSITAADRELPYRAMPPGDKYLLVMDGADHMAFNGRGDRAGDTGNPSPHVVRVVGAATIAFWRWTLMGDEAGRDVLKTADLPLDDGDRIERR